MVPLALPPGEGDHLFLFSELRSLSRPTVRCGGTPPTPPDAALGRKPRRVTGFRRVLSHGAGGNPVSRDGAFGREGGGALPPSDPMSAVPGDGRLGSRACG